MTNAYNLNIQMKTIQNIKTTKGMSIKIYTVYICYFISMKYVEVTLLK